MAAAESTAPPSAELDEIEQCLQQLAREAACSFEARALSMQEDALAYHMGREIRKNNQLLSPDEALVLAHACDRELDRRGVPKADENDSEEESESADTSEDMSEDRTEEDAW